MEFFNKEKEVENYEDAVKAVKELQKLTTEVFRKATEDGYEQRLGLEVMQIKKRGEEGNEGSGN